MAVEEVLTLTHVGEMALVVVRVVVAVMQAAHEQMDVWMSLGDRNHRKCVVLSQA